MAKVICSNELLDDARRAIAGAKQTQPKSGRTKDERQTANSRPKEKAKDKHSD
jgi:hypothetical protein